jgi:ABC-2 type transport system permease protein
MKKFTNLLKKEIRELLTAQLLVSLLFMMALFYFIGDVTKREVAKASGTQTVAVLDFDDSEASRGILKGMEAERFAVQSMAGKTKEQAIQASKDGDAKVLLVIPKGFGQSLTDFQVREIETYSFMRNFSMVGSRTSAILKGVLTAMNNVISDRFLKAKIPESNPDSIKNPIKSRDYVVVKDKMAEGSAVQIAQLLSSQTIFIPVILMMIIIYSSQMVITTVAMEKQNKTLETLLTVPIRRTSIITAKMLAAGLVGLLSAGIYMLGFRSFTGGMTSGLEASSGMTAAMRQLGLSFSTSGYVFLGISLFFAILCALAISMILGVLAEDFRSAQSLIMPVVLIVMIPYFISLFADLNSLSLPVKILVMAIPFSHPFLAVQNLYLQNYGAILAGIGYEVVVFAVLVLIAARIFSSDKILTMKLHWGKKRAKATTV